MSFRARRELLVRVAPRYRDASYQHKGRILDRPASDDAWQADRFLASSWGTLHARLRPVLGENIVRTFAGADFKPADLYGPKPATVYLRWPEEDLAALTPLVRLLWTTILSELVAHYDRVRGKDCLPILALVGEAGRAPVPSTPPPWSAA